MSIHYIYIVKFLLTLKLGSEIKISSSEPMILLPALYDSLTKTGKESLEE